MSFGNVSRSAENCDVQKYAIRRLEPSISKFLKVLEIDLDRQHRHRLNIHKLIVQEDWTALHKEQINASRTVQQIKANIREIEKARSQTLDEDLAKFDEKVEAMKEKAVQSIEAFTTNRLVSSSSDSNTSADVAAKSLPASLGNQQVQLHVVPPNSEAAVSWENLQENLQELNEMIHEFAQLVEAQGESIDRIEDNIDKAQLNVNSGVHILGKASSYKSAILPVAGAVIGGVCAGPLGLLAGAKIGAVLGMTTGAAAGFMSGRAYKKHQDNITEVEMSNLTQRRSVSESDANANANEDVEDAVAPEQKSSMSDFLPWNWTHGKQHSESSKDDT